MASGYGYRTFGQLMCDRQTRAFVETADDYCFDVTRRLREAGISRRLRSCPHVVRGFAFCAMAKVTRPAERGFVSTAGRTEVVAAKNKHAG